MHLVRLPATSYIYKMPRYFFLTLTDFVRFSVEMIITKRHGGRLKKDSGLTCTASRAQVFFSPCDTPDSVGVLLGE